MTRRRRFFDDMRVRAPRRFAMFRYSTSLYVGFGLGALLTGQPYLALGCLSAALLLLALGVPFP
jgi:hypothetical protein